MKSWNALKLEGSSHYRGDIGDTQPVDLFRVIKPHPTLTAFDVKALTDVIKYATRQLHEGINIKDMTKMVHYLELVVANVQEKGGGHLDMLEKEIQAGGIE